MVNGNLISALRNMVDDIEKLGAAPLTVDLDLLRRTITALTTSEGCTLLGIPVVFNESIAPGTFELRKQKPRLIGWRMADYTHETADRSVARNWASNVNVLPIFEGDPNTTLAARPEVPDGSG